MLSRLATVLQELSGEEGTDGDPQDLLVPQLPVAEGQAPVESEAPEEVVERLAHMEQLVVQLKELIREKDTLLIQKDSELANKDVQFKNEKEEFEARFTKLKLQAKAKMASLNKQIADLKGPTPSPDSSFSSVGLIAEEELQELKNKLDREEANSRALQEQLQTTELLIQEKETAHSEQLLKLQVVICEKDVRFQEQIQKHEEELLRVTTKSQNENEFQQALHAAQRRCEELEEALNSRSQVLEMLQYEVSSADQQKQILTAQFREMEQELTDAVRQRDEERQQWAEQTSRNEAQLAALRSSVEQQNMELARQENELVSLRKAAFDSEEALEKEKVEGARLEREMALMKDSELAAIQASHDTSERDKAEIARLESELSYMREAVEHANQDSSEKDKSEMDKLERELASLKEMHEDAQNKGEILAEIWSRLRCLVPEDEQPAEELHTPVDLSLFLDTVQSIEMQLTRLKDEHSESEEYCAKLTHTIEVLHEQLDRKNTEQEETTGKIQELEQHILKLSERDDVTEPPASDSSEDKTVYILELKQKLLEKDNELATIQESLRLAKEHSSSGVSSSEKYDQSPDQGHDVSTLSCESSTAPRDLIEDTQEEDTTLVAEDTSIISLSADIDSNSELIEQHSESPEEYKRTPSDEMVTSSDSEVAHSSWTLLEAVNQDGGQEWPSLLQDFSQMQLQSWEATSIESESSTVQVESSSVTIRETVQVHVTQHCSSATDSNISPDQAFAQALAEELQKRYSDLLAELQKLREAAAESQEKIKKLEEDTQSLSVAKQEAESQANTFAEELKSAKEELDKLSQESSSVVEKHDVEFRLLEDQIDILNGESKAKEEKIQVLLTDLLMAQQAVSEQEDRAKMLSIQLEDRELISSDLEKRIQDMEYSMLEYSQTSELNTETLSKKDSEISDLQLRLSQKEQEVKGLNDSMTTKLLQAEEEKFQIGSEVDNLKEQIMELERVRDERQKVSFEDSPNHEDDELASLRSEKSVLETQLTNTKKRLQAALVQRKDLMKKVADFELEAEKRKDQAETDTGGTPTNILEVEQSGGHMIEEMETKIYKLEEALRSKEKEVETLEQKIVQQDQALSELLAVNKKLSEEAENLQQPDISAETTLLQSQLTSLEAECETLQKKVQEVQESRKDTIRKAKEKDRHHREQLKQQKDEYNDLMERFQVQSGDHEVLQSKLKELKGNLNKEREGDAHQNAKQLAEKLEKQAAGDWVQEDWVDFATSEIDSSQPQSPDAVQRPAEHSEALSAEMESLQALREEIKTLQMDNTQLEKLLQETQASLSLKEAELLELGKELKALREKEKQIDVLSKEISDLREKHSQAESYAESLKAEMEAAEKAQSADNSSSIAKLQAELEDFKQFLDSKNLEISELGQQLSEQSSFIQSMQETVSHKDQLISSLQDSLKAEQEKTQKVEVEVPLKQEDEKESEAKIQQLQRKLHAALISRKEALKENKSQKEELDSTKKVIDELQQKIESTEDELKILKAEKVKLIDEVDRTLLENQSLGSSCESLKMVMEGVLNEKDACKRELDLAKEEAARMCGEWEVKVQGMKDEYETLLKSYENVSDEAERVRRVLEAARQERQELASRVRTHESVRQEAEKQAEEARKEVETVKDKMRKFAKTKQQKILDLEEENERLREMQEKDGIKQGDKGLKAEIDRHQDELGALKSELDATVVERDSLRQQIEELKDQLSQTIEKKEDVVEARLLSSAAVAEDVVTAQQADTIMTRAEHGESQHEETVAEQRAPLDAPETHLKPTDQNDEMTDNVQILLENKMRELETTVNAERELWQKAEAELKAQLTSLEQNLKESKANESLVASLEKSLQEGKERENNLIEEGSKREAQLKELFQRLEMEKDNLEERLMNQLAQLNGSIADYQQDAADNRDHLTELRREVERLERERAELEAEAQSESERAARLEEDMRQAQRERAEAEAESGKQRELEQKLRSAQRVKEGSQSRARQLEELLREKQLEVRQLQKDCIKYQERISELCREAKVLQLDYDELQKALEKSLLETTKTGEDLKKTEAELVDCKSQLDESQKQVNEALAAKTTLEQDAQKKEALMKAEAEQTLDSVRFRLGAELKEMELRLEDAYNEREKEEEATFIAREMSERAETRAQEAQARLDESLARLAAFSRCMSSLQDDRDRVLDEAKQWELRFNDALRGKETEVREAETRAKELAEQLQRESTLKEELMLSVDRLEKTDKDWQLKHEEEEKKFLESQAALEEEKVKLHQTTTELQSSLSEALVLKNEVESLQQRARALEEAVGRLQGEVDQARTEQREREAEERRLCLNVEQLAADLRSSKALTESLQTELHEKERREVEMLGEREQAVAEAAEEARKEADSRAQGAEKELEQRRSELRELEEKLRKTEEEGNNRKTRLDSFMKAMGSLQDDRDRVLNMYKQLEEKHLQVMLEKDALIQEGAGENNSLKEELRSLLVQRDDLHAEKAKLSAQLHGYRDDLNQVLSMKDSQHKKLLATQRERITFLEREHQELESQLESVSKAREMEIEAGRVERESLSQAADLTAASQATEAASAEAETLKEQLEAAREQVEALEETLLKERQEHESRSKELAELRWEGGVMRTESESAQERVAELAGDLLAVEQKLLEKTEETTQLRAENQSLSKAMASLQDNRDQAVDRAQELSLKLEEVTKAGGHATHGKMASSTGEVWGLKNALQALQNDRERLLEQLQTQTSELNKQKSELARLGAGELIKVSQELFEEKQRNEDMLGEIVRLENVVEMSKQEIDTLSLERIDWTDQAEQLKQHTLATLSDRDQQIRQLTAMLEEARAHKPKLEEHYQREGTNKVDSPPGAPQERSSLQDGHTYMAEVKELQRSQAKWHSAQDDNSETAVFIEPPEGSITRTQRGGPGLMRMLRVVFCSRQRTFLLFSLYLLTVHVLLLLCLGGIF
ncbi:golgin subfamily B member 1 isoform X2 [Antennarius striatus]|uniref:golgin subfamily B member 1 isoform X2 n=1 Tax=Antennarius striatus TaxID=241820 RepID=UPI0035B2C0FD